MNIRDSRGIRRDIPWVPNPGERVFHHTLGIVTVSEVQGKIVYTKELSSPVSLDHIDPKEVI